MPTTRLRNLRKPVGIIRATLGEFEVLSKARGMDKEPGGTTQNMEEEHYDFIPLNGNHDMEDKWCKVGLKHRHKSQESMSL
jgi:hypothetical protein